MLITETVYIGRNNVIDLHLTWRRPNGVVDPPPAITSMVLVDSKCQWTASTTSGLITWAVADDGASIDVVLSLGQANIPAGRHNCALIYFDAVNTDGIVWDEMILEVK